MIQGVKSGSFYAQLELSEHNLSLKALLLITCSMQPHPESGHFPCFLYSNVRCSCICHTKLPLTTHSSESVNKAANKKEQGKRTTEQFVQFSCKKAKEASIILWEINMLFKERFETERIHCLIIFNKENDNRSLVFEVPVDTYWRWRKCDLATGKHVWPALLWRNRSKGVHVAGYCKYLSRRSIL